MLDHVIAYVGFDPSAFTFGEFMTDSRWTLTRNAKTDTGEVRWEKLTHVAPPISERGPSPLMIVLDLKRNRVEVRVTLPRLLCGNNWQAMAESDMPRACRLVDEYLARHLGGLARQLPPFFDWPIRRAEYPHDVFVGSRGAVERWLHALNGQPLHKTSMVGRPYRDSARGHVSGLTWGTKGTRRKTTIYDKFEQCKDKRCPSDVVRIETAVQNASALDGLRTPEMRAQGRVMTVGEAGTVRVAAQVLEDTYDALRLGERAQVGIGDPYPLLVPYYGEPKARTLAGFHAYLRYCQGN